MLLELPALEPPAGVVPNFDNPPARRDMALGITIPCLSVTVVVTLLRLYVKTFIVKKWHLEDWLLPVAFGFSIGLYTPVLHAYTVAPVVHQWDLRLRSIQPFQLDFHVGAIFYDVTMLALKACILIQFLRIFVPRGERNFTFWATHVLLWSNTIFYTIIVLIEIFGCHPMKKAWDPLVVGGHCVNAPITYLVEQTFNFVLDALILIWTQVIIWRLHMTIKKKMQLGVLFFAGLLACIAAGFSIYINVRIFTTTDQTYWAALMALATLPETTSGFLVLCLPVVPKFVKHIRTKYMTSSVKSSTPIRSFDTPERRSPRSWWHVSVDSISTKVTALGSRISSTPGSTVGLTRDGSLLRRNHPDTIIEEVKASDERPFAFGPREFSLQLPDCGDSIRSVGIGILRSSTHDSERILHAQPVYLYRPSGSRSDVEIGEQRK
ncbi:hypothetical protein BDV96DRAFT_509151 [Lophiotrema nucula]|uniref:Rhodopsin domain-containing protein n=1 Tax=Lophiotrema nucula TaxID=690887 RepID=A0A6A5YE58_9PLEO|nr:hypothetical protein BDV96DRAFT_509151 [Lophiotrema nucula]